MGLRDRLTGGGEKERAPLDHYELMYSQHGATFKQAKVDTDLDVDLKDVPVDQPLDEEGVKETAQVEAWPEGYYCLKERMEDNTYGAIRWKFEHELDDDQIEEEVDPVESALVRIDERLRELEGSGSIASPDEAYGEVFSRMLEGDEVNVESAQALRAFLREWGAATQEPPSSPGEFAGRLAQDRYEAGDTEGATTLLDAWFQADTAGEGGSLLGKALEGDVQLDGEVGLLELAGLDAYTRMEPALDRLADRLGESAADAVGGRADDDLLASALAGAGRGDGRQDRDEQRVDEADDVVTDDVPDESGDDGFARDPDDVAALSEAFDGPRRAAEAGAPEADPQPPSTDGHVTDALAAPLDDDEAADIAASAAGGE